MNVSYIIAKLPQVWMWFRIASKSSRLRYALFSTKYSHRTDKATFSPNSIIYVITRLYLLSKSMAQFSEKLLAFKICLRFHCLSLFHNAWNNHIFNLPWRQVVSYLLWTPINIKWNCIFFYSSPTIIILHLWMIIQPKFKTFCDTTTITITSLSEDKRRGTSELRFLVLRSRNSGPTWSFMMVVAKLTTYTNLTLIVLYVQP